MTQDINSRANINSDRVLKSIISTHLEVGSKFLRFRFTRQKFGDVAHSFARDTVHSQSLHGLQSVISMA